MQVIFKACSGVVLTPVGEDRAKASDCAKPTIESTIRLKHSLRVRATSRGREPPWQAPAGAPGRPQGLLCASPVPAVIGPRRGLLLLLDGPKR